MIDIFYAGPEEEAEGEVLQFVYYEPDEFADPVYEMCRGGKYYGELRVANGGWYADFCNEYSYPEGFLKDVASKLRELNDALKETKRGWW